ncbi:uncharacterized protein BCR38DRAFT_90895 [Pseudomassariella vexata]|uniref:CCHC-type domain-containing protein n=1 Tax=Pseudomassariella vexata TaxID=1141098 RepID=A0A1Y2EDR4_9PEZI|nr:uncharacterized protein BCR38DRAFT_90895 [Pseudomassariella vexata]ORY69719.1 hypothetical protein BCR38DRAFT_90895 [Pseudomassariella vexata]
MASQTPKSMSSRLLTMKFMQRAAVSPSPASSPSTPKSEEKSSKRRKISHGTPSTATVAEPQIDRVAIQAAIDEGERKREAAIVKQAAELGDARWVLDVQNPATRRVETPLNVVQVGFSQIDSSKAAEDEDSTDDSDHHVQHFRRYNMEKKKPLPDAPGYVDESASDAESSDESHSPGRNSRRQSYNDSPRMSSGNEGNNTPRNARARRTAEKVKAKDLAEKRRKKEVKLNKPAAGGLTSLSSGGNRLQSLSSGGAMAQRPAFQGNCHACGKSGHMASSCPGKTALK